ncbi:Beta-ketoacyl synthase [Metarhizium album ARSEF 1941]|uniref:Beta-ketoacyl synthase n=1 Tax=Metarhizium album (strain ARSEF 1941) TaxID=1081103 RepID=A0A0B2WKD5_METAS|nr:Beta-ketoacyl synthase [Metarhizium album ARSEF 1941]KHN94383.1 Beta-ketoacyl synthase [Metarhizium album ARSEF 1941]
MELGVTKILLFGDQTVEKLPAIRRLVSHASSSRLVQRFLREACDAVQLEVGKLPAHSEERRNIGNFDSILRLAEDNSRLKEPSEIVATVLMNIVRIGELLLYAEQDVTVLASESSRNCILGFSTGELAAAVAAVAQDTNELVGLGVEATHIVFRMALELFHRSVMVDRTNGPWARTVLGISADRVRKILVEFHESHSIPRVRRACVGFLSDSWLTVFGPPTTLQQLFEWSAELEDAPHIETDACMGVHMETLPELDLGRILGSSAWLNRAPGRTTTIVSPYTCQPRRQQTLRGLLEEILMDVGQRTLHLAAATDAILDLARTDKLRVVMPGYTSHDVHLLKSLQRRGIEYSVMSHGDHLASKPAREGSGRVAIVGMSGRFPGSSDVDTFWEGLLQGKRHVQEIPSTRFDLEQWYDATGKQKNSTMARTGAFLDRPGMFDNRLFHMSPREAMQTDVQHRLLMTTSYEALEMAGYFPDGTPSTNRDRVGSYFGQTTDDWRELAFQQGEDIYFTTGSNRAFGPGRLQHHFQWGGPSYSVDSACSSSVAAVGLACSALLGRECDMALAGGGSLLLSPSWFSGLSRGGFLSTHGGCQTFHDDADGYVRGEGVGVVVLKRLEDALDDQDNILGVIRGSGRNYSSDASSIMHPSVKAQQQLYRDVLESSGVDANSISYVEMHGTGTQAGDFTEMSSVLSVFAEKRGPDNPLVVGAVKASIGHGEAAAGVCALIKTLMMLQSRRIPPQPELPGPVNHRFPNLGARNVHIAARNMRLEASPVAEGTLRVFLNSFDASGGNSCLLLEEAPPRAVKDADPRCHHVVTLSARSQKSLIGIKERYLAYLRRNPGIKLADLVYTTNARRTHGPLRYAVAASSVDEVMQGVEADLTRGGTPGHVGETPAVVFIFTGQGSQYSGMGSHLWKTWAAFRNKLHDYQTMASAQGLPHFLDLITENSASSQQPGSDAVKVQLAILCLELALAELWRSWGVRPATVLGHSLGEYAALCVAGVLTVSDAIYVVAKRAQIMAEALTPHKYGMLAMNLSVDDAREVLSSGKHVSCAVACINAPRMTVVSGPRLELEELQNQLKSDGTRCTYLPVPYGFHSSQLDPILAQFEAACQGVNFSTPHLPIVSSLLATSVRGDGTFSPGYLARQAREPVDFVGALAAVQEQRFPSPVFLEIGPDPVCSGLVNASLGADGTKVRCLASMHREKDNWASISSSLRDVYVAGVAIDWPAYHREFKSSVSLLDLPKYSFEEKEFWAPFPGRSSRAIGEAEADQGQPHVVKPSVQGYFTTTLQRVVKETVQSDGCSVTFTSDLTDQDLRTAVRGHVVAGAEICSSSILLDMALSAAQYVYAKQTSGQSLPFPLTVRNCCFHRAVVFAEKAAQTVEVSVNLASSSKTADVQYRCRTSGESYEVGTCQVVPGPAGKPAQAGFLARSRMAALKASASHRLGRRAVYRLFDNIVRYSEEYKGLDNVHLSEDMQDAMAEINMAQASAAGGHYLHHPFLLDSIVHLSGFLLNNGLRYSDEWACLCTGFEEWHLLKPLDPANVYTGYTFMEESSSTRNLVTGDVYVYHGDDLVSVLAGLQFQKMKRTALTHLLRPPTVRNAANEASSYVPAAPQTKAKAWPAQPIATIHQVNNVAGPEVPAPPTPASMNGGGQPGLVDALFAIVAREVGVERSDLNGDMSLEDLGVDSLMAVAIISAVQQETGVELPAAFFLDNPTTTAVTEAAGRLSACC